MALAVATPTIVSTDQTQKHEIVHGTLAIGASPLTYTAGGIVLDFTKLDFIKSGTVPKVVHIMSSPAAGTSPSGFLYFWCPGTTLANGKVAIFEDSGANAAMAELATAAIPAAVSGDTIIFQAWFARI